MTDGRQTGAVQDQGEQQVDGTQGRRPQDREDSTRGSGGDTYDVVVVVAGPVGEIAAELVVQGGLSVALVEAELVGGECSYWACMPSKALLRSGQVLRAARAVPGAREAVTGELDAQAVLGRRDAFASHYDDRHQVSWLDGAGITLVRGHGRLAGPRQVEVTAPTGARCC